ncbi:hypothetical protein [Paenibacillus sp. FSL W8-0194]
MPYRKKSPRRDRRRAAAAKTLNRSARAGVWRGFLPLALAIGFRIP